MSEPSEPKSSETPETTSSEPTQTSDNNDQPEVHFKDMNPDEDIERMAEVESVCMNCHENGTTRMLLTRIPFFKDVIIMSFSCPHCFWRNNELSPATALDDAGGVSYTLTATADDEKQMHEDLNRQIVKSAYATVRVPDLEFEIPPVSRRGEILTVEAVFFNIFQSLECAINDMEEGDDEKMTKLMKVCKAFKAMSEGKRDFRLEISDPSGNSFIENPCAPKKDPRCRVKRFKRTNEMLVEMGYGNPQETQPEDESLVGKDVEGLEQFSGRSKDDNIPALGTGGQPSVQSMTIDAGRLDKLGTYFDVTTRSCVLRQPCRCGKEALMRMCCVDIPHFKEVIIMVTECEHCGYKDSEVKPGGEIAEKGMRVSLTVKDKDDLKRDLMKSDTSGLSIPEIGLDMDGGTLGGKYTTVEGILLDIREQLNTMRGFGDSSASDKTSKMDEFLKNLDECIECKREFTLILDDPLGNCHIEHVGSGVGIDKDEEKESDPRLKVEQYTRTFEQNEDLGLNQMKVENYTTEETEGDSSQTAPTNDSQSGDPQDEKETSSSS